MQMNLNEYVWVQLTDRGRAVYRSYIRRTNSLIAKIPPEQQAIVDRCLPNREPQWHRFHMWELMNIFGVHMVMANDRVFLGNNIRFDQP